MFTSPLYSDDQTSSIGQYTFQQNLISAPIIASIIEFERPDLVVEIGTGSGGFCSIIQELTRVPYDFYTLDVTEPPDCARLHDLRIKFELRDCFDERLKCLIKENARKKILILCDGGNKNKEFTAFAPLLKENDIIMAHDSRRGIKDDRPDDWMNFWMGNEFSYKFDDEELSLWKFPWWYWLASKAGWYGAKRT